MTKQLSHTHTHTPTHRHRYRQRFVLNKTFKCKQNNAIMWLYIVCILFKEGWLLLGKVSKLLKLKKKNFNKKQSCFFFSLEESGNEGVCTQNMD